MPPNVATSYVTDVNSPAIPALNVLNELGNYTSVDNVNGIQTDGSSGSNTLTIQLTNRLTGSGTAVGAVTVDLTTFALSGSASVYRFSFLIAGKDTILGTGVGYTVEGTVFTDGVTAVIIQTPDIDADEGAGVTGALSAIVVSGNNVILRVTGVAGQTIVYKSVGTYVVV